MLDGVGRKLIDQKAEGHGTIGIDFQRLGFDLYFDARHVSNEAPDIALAISRRYASTAIARPRLD